MQQVLKNLIGQLQFARENVKMAIVIIGYIINSLNREEKIKLSNIGTTKKELLELMLNSTILLAKEDLENWKNYTENQLIDLCTHMSEMFILKKQATELIFTFINMIEKKSFDFYDEIGTTEEGIDKLQNELQKALSMSSENEQVQKFGLQTIKPLVLQQPELLQQLIELKD